MASLNLNLLSTLYRYACPQPDLLASLQVTTAEQVRVFCL